MIILLLRRINPRYRFVAGAIIAAGVALIGVAAAAARGLLIHGIALTCIGIGVRVNGYVIRRRALQSAVPGTVTGQDTAGYAARR